MAWRTRELAELAGTTLKTVRYYHRIGLLDEPERAANGYKRHHTKHLIRLLRIRRLVDLPPGFDGNVTDLSDVERSLLMIYSRVLDATAITTMRELHSSPRPPVQAEFDALPADADEATSSDWPRTTRR